MIFRAETLLSILFTIKKAKPAEWKDDFDAFRAWALAHGYAPGLQIDRINNDGNYEPGNCRWVSVKQNRRNSSQVRLVTAFGETKSVTEWSEDPRCVVTVNALSFRIRAGNMSIEEAITTPSVR